MTVAVNDTKLSGRVARVLPSIQNGVVKLEARFDQPSSELLKPNLRVDVQIVLGKKERALVIPRGSFPGAGAAPEVFVVRGNVARRVPVKFGLANAERLEIVSGLSEGDEVILTGLDDLNHLKEIAVR